MNAPNTSPMQIGIVDAAYCLPGDPVDIVDWARTENVAPQLVERLLANGCRYFHIGTDRSDLDVIADAADQVFAATQVEPAHVDYLVHAHTQTFSMPAPPESILSSVVQRYGMQPKLAFSVGHLACASIINAIQWAAELLANDDDAHYALVVTSDRVFGKAKHRIRQDAGIQSDGGSAILLGKHHLRCRLAHFGIRNFDKLHDGPSTPALSAAIGRTTWVQTKLLLEAMCTATGLPLSHYAQILPINADGAYWKLIAKSLGLSDAQFYLENIGRRGHGCCTDFAVNLVDRGFSLLDAGQSVLACGQSNLGAHAALALSPVQPDAPLQSTSHQLASTVNKAVAPHSSQAALAIRALRVDWPAAVAQNSLLGTEVPRAYMHLFDEAGAFSRPPTVPRGVTYAYSSDYMAPAASPELRVSEMASSTVSHMLRAIPGASAAVQAVLHAQCTLDQQIVASPTLRVRNENFPEAPCALHVGQLGTAGVPTAFALAQHYLAQDGGRGLVCVSAADKWIAPFVRRHTGVLTYADASAACLVEAAPAASGLAVAEIVASAIAHNAAPTEARAQSLAAMAIDCIQRLLAQCAFTAADIAGVAGDAYDADLNAHIAQQTQLTELPGAKPCAHAASASTLAAIEQGLQWASTRGQSIYAVIWTASLSGHVAALLVHCHAHARKIDGTWIAPQD